MTAPHLLYSMHWSYLRTWYDTSISMQKLFAQNHSPARKISRKICRTGIGRGTDLETMCRELSVRVSVRPLLIRKLITLV